MKTVRTLKLAMPLAVAAFAFASITSGCSPSAAPTQQQLYIPTTINWHIGGFANASNPYDTVGLRHNQCLDYVAARLSSVVPGNQSYPGTDTLTVRYIDSIYGYPPDSGLWIGRHALTHKDSLFNVMNTGGKYAPVAVYDIWDIDSVIRHTLALGDSAAIDSIKGIENSAAVILTGNDLALVQIVGAIGRYSLSYWTSSDTLKWAGKREPIRAVVNGVRPKGGIHSPLMSLPSWLVDDGEGAIQTASDYGDWWFVPSDGISQACGVFCCLLSAAMSSGGDF